MGLSKLNIFPNAPINVLTIKQKYNNCINMKMIATRDLVTRSAKVMNDLEKNGWIVVTKGGKPRSIMIPTSEASFLEDVDSIIYMRARNSLKKAQLRAVESGRSNMSIEEIDAEIAAARKERKK